MDVRRKREGKQRVIVVLEGTKVCKENTGIAPLLKAVRQVINADDEILVLIFLHFEEATASSYSGGGAGECNQLCENDPHITFLRREISHRKEAFKKILRPFHVSCKLKQVKFQVKIVAGYRLKDVIIEEALNAKATWIVIDSCFSEHISFRLAGTDCNVSLVSEDDDEAMVHAHPLDSYDRSECSLIMEEIRNPQGELHMDPSLSPSHLASTSKQSENQDMSESIQGNKEIIDGEPQGEEVHGDSPIMFPKTGFLRAKPLQLSWEVIVEITGKFATKALMGKCKNYMAYLGYFSENHSFVLVKRFTGDFCSNILEAEKKAAWSMHHKNILGLLGFHQSDSATVLVHPHPRGGTLDITCCPLGNTGQILKFRQKLKIAIGIAQGVRYMHQECPRGPIVHGELQLHNIFLSHDLRPLISGFGKATWLHHEHASTYNNRHQLEDPLNHKTMELLKSDVFSFGVLLLRLFCRRSMPQDSRSLIEWARPLMLQRKFHELLDEELEFSDMHGIYRVMATATQCTISRPSSRPCMSQVISILKGENFSCIQSTPSGDSSS